MVIENDIYGALAMKASRFPPSNIWTKPAIPFCCAVFRKWRFRGCEWAG